MTKCKKLHLSLAALLLTTGIVSSAQATVYDSKVRRHGGFYVEVEPFWVKAHDSLLTTWPYAITLVDITDGTLDTSIDRTHYFDNDYEWGWRVAVGYDYPSCDCCNYGFSLEYTQFNHDDHKRLTGFIDDDGLGGDLFPFDSFEGIFIEGFTDVRAHYDQDYQTWDLLGHKNMTVCKCVDVQWFAGARYLQLDQDWRAHYFTNEETTDAALAVGFPVENKTIDYNNRFDGAGPRVGFNAFFPVVCNFGLTTEVAGDLLFGISRSQYHEHHSVVDLIDDTLFTDEFDFRANPEDRALVVPALSGKIGLAYRAVFRNCSSFVIEAGYRGNKFFGVSDHGAFVNALSTEESLNKNAAYHDFDFSGAYLTLSFHA